MTQEFYFYGKRISLTRKPFFFPQLLAAFQTRLWRWWASIFHKSYIAWHGISLKPSHWRFLNEAFLLVFSLKPSHWRLLNETFLLKLSHRSLLTKVFSLKPSHWNLIEAVPLKPYHWRFLTEAFPLTLSLKFSHWSLAGDPLSKNHSLDIFPARLPPNTDENLYWWLLQSGQWSSSQWLTATPTRYKRGFRPHAQEILHSLVL